MWPPKKQHPVIEQMKAACLEKIGLYDQKIADEIRRLKKESRGMKPNSEVLIEGVPLTKTKVKLAIQHNKNLQGYLQSLAQSITCDKGVRQSKNLVVMGDNDELAQLIKVITLLVGYHTIENKQRGSLNLARHRREILNELTDLKAEFCGVHNFVPTIISSIAHIDD